MFRRQTTGGGVVTQNLEQRGVVHYYHGGLRIDDWQKLSGLEALARDARR